MVDFIFEIFRPVNLPATLLLGFIVVYWLLVILGALGWDALDLDFDVAGEGGDVEGDLAGQGGPWAAVFEFFHLGEVPLTLLASLFAFFYWFTTVVSNHYINPEWSWLVALYMLTPCVLSSLLITKLVVSPAVPFFRRLSLEGNERTELLGRLGVVSTSELTDAFGQVEIQQDGPPIILNARSPGAKLSKGDVVELVRYESDSNTYVVRLSK